MSGNPPAPTASADQFLAWSRHNASVAMLGSFLDVAGQFLFFVFLAILVRHAEPAGGYLSNLVLAGGISAMVIDTVWAGLILGQRYLAIWGGDANSVRALALASLGFAGPLNNVIAIPYCLLYGSLAVLILSTRILPAPFAWVAIILAVLAGPGVALSLLIPGMSLPLLAAFILTLLWPLAVGVYLLIRQPRS